MAKSVVIVTAIAPYPVDNGRRAFLAGLLEYLVDRFGPEHVHYALVAADEEELPDMPCQLHHLPSSGTATKLTNLAKAAATGRLSLQESLLSSPDLKRAVAALMLRLQPDIELYDTVRMGQHRSPHRQGTRQILNYDDLYSLRYRRMLAVDARVGASFNPLGEFASHLPSALRTLAKRPVAYRSLLRRESKLLARREQQLATEFSDSLLLNSNEVSLMQRTSGFASVHLITPYALTPEVVRRDPAHPPEFVFLGRLNVPHNDDAICSFISSAMPGLLRLIPEARLHVLGKGASDELRQLTRRFGESIVLDGFVDDLDETFARATAVLAPLRFGTGVKTKILDALARHVPVIGTSTALEGIPARLDQQDARSAVDGCLLSDKLSDWPRLLAQLVDPTTNAAVSRGAGDFFDRTYSQDTVWRQYDEIFGVPPSPRGSALPSRDPVGGDPTAPLRADVK